MQVIVVVAIGIHGDHLPEATHQCGLLPLADRLGDYVDETTLQLRARSCFEDDGNTRHRGGDSWSDHLHSFRKSNSDQLQFAIEWPIGVENRHRRVVSPARWNVDRLPSLWRKLVLGFQRDVGEYGVCFRCDLDAINKIFAAVAAIVFDTQYVLAIRRDSEFNDRVEGVAIEAANWRITKLIGARFSRSDRRSRFCCERLDPDRWIERRA